MKVCIINSLTRRIRQGETSETAMKLAAATDCEAPYFTYIRNSICKEPVSRGCDEPEVANKNFMIILIKSIFDDCSKRAEVALGARGFG